MTALEGTVPDPGTVPEVIGARRAGSLVGRLLTGSDPTPAERVAVAMVGGGLMLIGTDPQLTNLEGDQLRAELLRCARALLAPTAPPAARRRPRLAASHGTD